MGNRSLIDQNIMSEMAAWSRAEYQDTMHVLAKQCTCNIKYISCVEIDPGMKPGYDPGFVFLGPKDTLLGEIRWDKKGRCSDFIVYEDNILEIRQKLAQVRARKAREKSVNQTRQQQEERQVSYHKGLEDLAYAIRRNIGKIAFTAAMLVVINAGFAQMKADLNPDYINDSYNAGYQAVNMETHRTIGNDGYWYDYGDIAARFDAETMDFDSYVYGTYKNVGWNQSSRIDCMDEVFDALEDRGLTSYDSFLEYCDAKGACVTKDGKQVISSKQFSEIMEDELREYNARLEEPSLQEEKTADGFRL